MDWVSGNGETGPLSWRREVSGIDAEGDITEVINIGAGYGTSGDERQRSVFILCVKLKMLLLIFRLSRKKPKDSKARN